MASKEAVIASKVLDVVEALREPADELDDIGPDADFMAVRLKASQITDAQFDGIVARHRAAVASGNAETIKAIAGIARTVFGGILRLPI